MNDAVLGESIVASTISSATWIPCSRYSCAAAWTSARVAAAPAAHSPRPGIARRALPPVTWISVPRSRADALGEEHEGLLGDRAGPAAEVLDGRLVERSAAERAVPGRPRGGDRVDDQVEAPELGSRPLERLAQLVGIGGVGLQRQPARRADGLQRLGRARDRGAAPAGVQVMAEDRAAEIAGAEDDERGHALIVARARADRELRDGDPGDHEQRAGRRPAR